MILADQRCSRQGVVTIHHKEVNETQQRYLHCVAGLLTHNPVGILNLLVRNPDCPSWFVQKPQSLSRKWWSVRRNWKKIGLTWISQRLGHCINRATLSPTKVGAGHPNDVHPPNDVFFPLCIQPPPTSTTQSHHVWILYQFQVSYRRGYRCISWRRIQVCKHCSSGIWSSCSNASKTTSRNSHLIIWTRITWICSEYWAKRDYMYIFDTSGQAVDFCSAEASSESSKFPTAAGKSREFFSSWTALVSTISTAKFSVFQEKTNFSCRW